jgi:hypothetical protein
MRLLKIPPVLLKNPPVAALRELSETGLEDVSD